MSKKGFTLVELLAVMTVLSIIMIIIFTGLGSSKDRADEKTKDIEKDTIKDAAITFYSNNKDIHVFSEDVYTYVCKVQLKDLKRKKILEMDKYLNSDINDETYVKVTDDSGVVTSEIVPEANVSSLNNVASCANLRATRLISDLISDANSNSIDVINVDAPEGELCTNTLAYDGTDDNNLRYVGANPCNYVSFNNELWRIVGIMNNIDNGAGKKETRIKLMRKDSLGDYSWDTSASGINSGYGINDWTQADLMQELNGDYLNTNLSANTVWYNGISNKQTGTFDYTKRLNAEAKGLISDAKWFLGGFVYSDTSISQLITNTIYKNEKGTTVWGSKASQTCGDGYCPRKLNWTGKVALIYPSDYGFATAGGTATTRKECVETISLYNNTSYDTWINSSYTDCKNNNWIPLGWALTPYSGFAYRAFDIREGNTGHNYTSNSYPVYPTIYLKSEAKISGGSGTPSDPYVIS